MAKTRFTTPVARFVQGSVDEAQTKDAQGQLRVVKSGPNAGQPNPQFFVAGAVPKNSPEWPPFWALLVHQAVADFPNLFPYGAQPIVDCGGPIAAIFQPAPAGWQPLPAFAQQAASGQLPFCLHPQFSFKVIDGDGFDQNGKPNNAKGGFAGHWVVRAGSAYPPRCFRAGHYAANEQIQEKNAIKRGYYIRINGSIEGNGQAQRPGLYVNLDMVELTAIYHEITSGPDAGTAFGGAPAALPEGIVPTMGAPAAPLPSAPPATLPPATLPPATLPPATLPAAPPATLPPAPYTGYMAPAAPAAPLAPAPVAPAPVPPPPTGAPSAPPATPSPSSGPVMLPAANGATYEQMLAAGWTDETLRAHGMMQ